MELLFIINTIYSIYLKIDNLEEMNSDMAKRLTPM